MSNYTKEQFDILIDKIDSSYREDNIPQLEIDNAFLKKMALEQNNQEAYLISRYNDTYRIYHEQKFTEVKDILEEILPGIKKHKMDLYLLRIYNTLGIIDSEMGHYYESLQFYIEAYRIAQKNPSFKYSSIILLNIGNLFVWLKEYKTAIDYLTKSYAMHQIEDIKHPTLLITIIVDIIEVYSMLDDFDKIEEWLKIPVTTSYPIQLILDTILLSNDIKKAYLKEDRKTAKAILPKILQNMKESDDYIYLFRTALHLMELYIRMKEKEECEKLIAAMDKKNKVNNIHAFMYDYATVKIKYFQTFFNEEYDPNDMKKFYEEYFKESQKTIYQFNQTYTDSLLVQIELDKTNEDKDRAIAIKSQLEKSLQLDGFTQVYNKIAFKQLVDDKQLDRNRKKSHAMVVLDIDHFKSVNDNYGHDVGDLVLLKVASLLKKISTANTITARFGGDEFVVYIYDLDTKEYLEEMLEKSLILSRRVVIPQSNNHHITTSLGAFYSTKEGDFETLFLKADEALYKSKKLGRNRYTIDTDENINS